MPPIQSPHTIIHYVFSHAIVTPACIPVIVAEAECGVPIQNEAVCVLTGVAKY